MDKHALAVMVRDKRMVSKLSVWGLAELVGTSASTISRIDRCEGVPGFDCLVALADWLKTPVERFYASKTASEERSIDRIAAVIMNDEDLDEDARHKLAAFMRSIYAETIQLTVG